MPMCHGAGGLQAQYRFGARTGLAPILFGSVLLVLAVGFADDPASLFAIIPIGAVGALLIMAEPIWRFPGGCLMLGPPAGQ